MEAKRPYTIKHMNTDIALIESVGYARLGNCMSFIARELVEKGFSGPLVVLYQLNPSVIGHQVFSCQLSEGQLMIEQTEVIDESFDKYIEKMTL